SCSCSRPTTSRRRASTSASGSKPWVASTTTRSDTDRPRFESASTAEREAARDLPVPSRIAIEPHLPEERRRLHEARGEWPVAGPSAALAARAASDPDRVLFVIGDERLTAVDVLARSERVASGLRRLGITAGDVVSWQLPNWVEGLTLTFALDRIGAIA